MVDNRNKSQPDNMSMYSAYTTESFDKPEPQPELERKSKGSLRQKVKKTWKSIGYPPTYFYDQEHGIESKHGYYGCGIPNQPLSRL